MAIKRLNYPYELDLIKASRWHDYQKYVHFIIRFHFHIVEYQAENTTHPGEILASFHTPDQMEIINAIEKEHSIVDVDETIFSQVISEELTSGIESELVTSLEAPLYKVSSRIGASIQEKLQKSFSQSIRESSTVSRRVMERFEVHQTITDDGKQTYHAVACYKPMQSDVYLHYIDYLFAEYKTTVFGLRKKKQNLPRPDGDNHPNRIKINQPLFTMKYWELLPKSSLIYLDSQYAHEKKKVTTPDRVILKRLDRPFHLSLPKRPERPTLYTLSNIAFPFLWINRKGDWSVEELKQIEFDEAKATGSAWWFQHGPGRNRTK